MVPVLRALVGRWRWMTLAALLSCAVMVRLGFWQLDRLAARREVNAQLAARVTSEPVQLGALAAGWRSAPPPGEALRELEYRPAVVRGRWDYQRERALPNQVWEGQIGLHLVTPLVLEGSGAVLLVDRGWVPGAPGAPAAAGGAAYGGMGGAGAIGPMGDTSTWVAYREPSTSTGGSTSTGTSEVAEVRGWIRLEQRGMPEVRRQVEAAGTGAAGAAGERVLPVFLVQAPGPGGEGRLPYKKAPVASIGEGVHAIAAAQWFLISGIVVVGMVMFASRRSAVGSTQ